MTEKSPPDILDPREKARVEALEQKRFDGSWSISMGTKPCFLQRVGFAHFSVSDQWVAFFDCHA